MDKQHLTVYDLLAMPEDERNAAVQKAFELASWEDFELFEANDDVMDYKDEAMTKRKTSYDYRRYILLVQVLAAYPTEEAVAALCEAWGVEPTTTRLQTLQKLAQHAIDYHKQEDNNNGN